MIKILALALLLTSAYMWRLTFNIKCKDKYDYMFKTIFLLFSIGYMATGIKFIWG